MAVDGRIRIDAEHVAWPHPPRCVVEGVRRGRSTPDLPLLPRVLPDAPHFSAAPVAAYLQKIGHMTVSPPKGPLGPARGLFQ